MKFFFLLLNANNFLTKWNFYTNGYDFSSPESKKPKVNINIPDNLLQILNFMKFSVLLTLLVVAMETELSLNIVAYVNYNYYYYYYYC